jgi:hypothetical protein
MWVTVIDNLLGPEAQIDKFVLTRKEYFFDEAKCAVEACRVLAINLLVDNPTVSNRRIRATGPTIWLNGPKQKR